SKRFSQKTLQPLLLFGFVNKSLTYWRCGVENQQITALFTLFVPQRLNGVCGRRFNCAPTYGEYCNGNGRNSCQTKYPPLDVNAIGKIFQPLIHDPPGNGAGNKQSDRDELDEVDNQQTDNTCSCCAQYLANTDLLRALVSGKSSQTE